MVTRKQAIEAFEIATGDRRADPTSGKKHIHFDDTELGLSFWAPQMAHYNAVRARTALMIHDYALKPNKSRVSNWMREAAAPYGFAGFLKSAFSPRRGADPHCVIITDAFSPHDLFRMGIAGSGTTNNLVQKSVSLLSVAAARKDMAMVEKVLGPRNPANPTARPLFDSPRFANELYGIVRNPENVMTIANHSLTLAVVEAAANGDGEMLDVLCDKSRYTEEWVKNKSFSNIYLLALAAALRFQKTNLATSIVSRLDEIPVIFFENRIPMPDGRRTGIAGQMEASAVQAAMRKVKFDPKEEASLRMMVFTAAVKGNTPSNAEALCRILDISRNEIREVCISSRDTNAFRAA